MAECSIDRYTGILMQVLVNKRDFINTLIFGGKEKYIKTASFVLYAVYVSLTYNGTIERSKSDAIRLFLILKPS